MRAFGTLFDRPIEVGLRMVAEGKTELRSSGRQERVAASANQAVGALIKITGGFILEASPIVALTFVTSAIYAAAHLAFGPDSFATDTVGLEESGKISALILPGPTTLDSGPGEGVVFIRELAPGEVYSFEPGKNTVIPHNAVGNIVAGHRQ